MAEPTITEERAARMICGAAHDDPNEFCYFKGPAYGKPFWHLYLGTARDVLGLQRQAAEAGGKLALALEQADAAFGFSMELVRLLEGVSTYRLKIDGEVFTYTDDSERDASEACYAHIARSKAATRSAAILAALGLNEVA